MCGKYNDEELVECQFCGARLKPMLAASSDDLNSFKPGEEPTAKDTSEFEKVKPVESDTIHPGEAPTVKNTAELEKALPTWLRDLREKKAEEGLAAGSDIISPLEGPASPEGDSKAGLPDWLAGLEKASTEDEEVPDWLAGLRGDKPSEPAGTPEPTSEPSSGISEGDWMSRLGGGETQPPAAEATPAPADENPDWLKSLDVSSSGETQPPAAEAAFTPAPAEETSDWLKSLEGPTSEETQPPVAEAAVTPPAVEKSAFEVPSEPAAADDTPDWLKSLDNSGSGESQPPAAEATPADDTPDWLKSLEGPTSGAIEPPLQPAAEENLPEWFSGLPDISPQTEPTPAGSGGSASMDNLPDWLNQLEEKGPEPSPAAAETPEEAAPAVTGGDTPSMDNLPDWLGALQDKGVSPETPAEPAQAEVTPDWLSGTPAETGPAAPAASADVPDWLSNLESLPISQAETPSAFPADAITDSTTPPGETPAWLTQLQSEINDAEEVEKQKDNFEPAPKTPIKTQ